ncbi:ABC-three component system middle component 6 [Spirosoma endbachense]|uniref:Uncharacterized protein n=1 Tax=Spirosoma endbachense TaxID=2666025 RepID=A0A6P1VVQ9_9BACT|nr:ABC-three component system middle component 6 [Spirosoma endbachense]QHV97301.1 hypothetical protein GJR95_20830 [Spirosoma endbachense]
MILPTKHIRISESLLGLGAFLLRDITATPQTVDDLIARMDKINRQLKGTFHGIDNLVLTLDFLYLIGSIDIDSEGKLYNAATETFIE